MCGSKRVNTDREASLSDRCFPDLRSVPDGCEGWSRFPRSSHDCAFCDDATGLRTSPEGSCVLQCADRTGAIPSPARSFCGPSLSPSRNDTYRTQRNPNRANDHEIALLDYEIPNAEIAPTVPY